MPVNANPSGSVDMADAESKSTKTMFLIGRIEKNIEHKLMQVTAGATHATGVILVEPILFRAEGKKFYLTKITDVIMMENVSRLIVTGEMSFDNSGLNPFRVKISLRLNKMYRMGTIELLS
jgi:hypothetical protein